VDVTVWTDESVVPGSHYEYILRVVFQDPGAARRAGDSGTVERESNVVPARADDLLERWDLTFEWRDEVEDDLDCPEWATKAVPMKAELTGTFSLSWVLYDCLNSAVPYCRHHAEPEDWVWYDKNPIPVRLPEFGGSLLPPPRRTRGLGVVRQESDPRFGVPDELGRRMPGRGRGGRLVSLQPALAGAVQRGRAARGEGRPAPLAVGSDRRRVRVDRRRWGDGGDDRREVRLRQRSGRRGGRRGPPGSVPWDGDGDLPGSDGPPARDETDGETRWRFRYRNETPRSFVPLGDIAAPGRPAAALTYRIEAVPKFAADRAKLTFATASTAFPGIATNYPADARGSEDDVQYRVTYERGGEPMELALGSASGFAHADLLESHVAPLFWKPSFTVPMRYQRGGPLEESRDTLETVRIEASTTDFGAHGHFAVQVDVEGEKSYVGLAARGSAPAKELLQLPLDNDKTGFPDDG
ncbi:MAG: hypothetical protein HYV63_00465, partial [Candidatus Schekmanbacteria bacterium]|nr:hypothetical protein [Candidatus Schekmanbacteria bacterium]